MKYIDTKNKMVTAGALVLILTSGVSFYTGMKYSEGKTGASSQIALRGGFGANRMGGAGGMMRGGGASSGEILAKDDKSVTIKLRNGGSAIIFFGASTQVMKSAPGAITDLSIGQLITAIGTANSDGSISAQSIQIRPATQATPATPQN